jgi:hypothetical protein
MFVQLYMHTGFLGGGQQLVVTLPLDQVFEDNPWITPKSRGEIEQRLLVAEKVQIGDDIYLHRPHFVERGE